MLALGLNKEYLGYEQIFVLISSGCGWKGTYLCFKAWRKKHPWEDKPASLYFEDRIHKWNCLLVCILIPEGVEELFCLNISSTHADSRAEELMCWLGKCKSLFHWCVLAEHHRDHCSVVPLPCLLDRRHFPLFLSVMRSTCQNKTSKPVQRWTPVAVVGT